MSVILKESMIISIHLIFFIRNPIKEPVFKNNYYHFSINVILKIMIKYLMLPPGIILI